eukprot:6203443-Pleurochrysis_carterae.AAC.3
MAGVTKSKQGRFDWLGRGELKRVECWGERQSFVFWRIFPWVVTFICFAAFNVSVPIALAISQPAFVTRASAL